MSAILRAALLTVCISLYAGAQNRSLALYAGEAHGLDPAALRSARQELQRLLSPTNIDLLWKDLTSRKSGEQFDHVVVVTFGGVCSEAGPALSAEVSLGDSSVSEGAVLPFFRVDCEYLSRMLTPSLRSMTSQQRSVAFGRALARVMAHEIYHIVGETTEHQSKGVAKASFSLQDLTAESFDFDSGSLPLLAHSRSAPTATSAVESEELLER